MESQATRSDAQDQDPQDQDPEWVQADPKARKQVLLAVFVCLALGLVCIAALSALTGPMGSHLDQLSRDDPHKAARVIALVVTSVIAAVVVPVSVLAMRFFRVAGRIWTTQQFPPPGMKVAKATRIVRGGRARGLAVILILLNLALLGCCVEMIRIDAQVVRCVAERANQMQPTRSP